MMTVLGFLSTACIWGAGWVVARQFLKTRENSLGRGVNKTERHTPFRHPTGGCPPASDKDVRKSRMEGETA
jgi:hypothetical protein